MGIVQRIIKIHCPQCLLLMEPKCKRDHMEKVSNKLDFLISKLLKLKVWLEEWF